ncbi:MAG TPA: AGE family epimerase/isomerase [Planctomycetaceae bacterium]|nr:AGE family epimerase/isomerase [Planctomycetaceae bacterium]
MSTTLRNEFKKLQCWLFEAALPRWSKTGVDDARGGFFEKIELNGVPGDGPRRTRLVAWEIYSFIVAVETGWSGSVDEVAAHGLRFFRDRCISAEEPVYSIVSVDGPP